MQSQKYLERIPGTQAVWRVASSYRLKTTEPPHRRSSLSHVHHKLCAEFRRKKRLCAQNRSAGFVLSCTNISGQQEVPTFCFQKQGISIMSTSRFFSLNTAPQVFTCLGHTVAA